MIRCTNCGHKNMTGAGFCTECGVVLLPNELNTTQKMDVEHILGAPQQAEEMPPSGPVPGGDNWITLHLVDTGEMFPLSEKNEFTLGRVADGQSVMPDVDLAPHQAYTHGVSRLHAVITRGVDDIHIKDLDSANGTYVNGSRLQANEERTLSNGDVVALGRLKMQVLLKSTQRN